MGRREELKISEERGKNSRRFRGLGDWLFF